MRKARLTVALLAGFALAAPVSALADDFSLERLRAGKEALRARRVPEAIDQLRIACFGLLEQVDALSECLVHLTLAQDAAKRPADVDATLTRFLEVERRFGPFVRVALPAETRREFETILRARVPEETLRATPSLAGLIETEEQRIAKLPPTERLGVLQAAQRREPSIVTWSIALIRTRTELKQWRQALDDMTKLPRDAWESHPELFADLFVCQVETKDWKGADASQARIPPPLVKRADVENAARDLAAEHGRRPPQ